MLLTKLLTSKTSELKNQLQVFGKLPSDTAAEDFSYYLLHQRDAVFVIPFLFVRFFGVTLTQGIELGKWFEEVVMQGYQDAFYANNRDLLRKKRETDPRLEELETLYPDIPEEEWIIGEEQKNPAVPHKPAAVALMPEASSEASSANFYFSPEDEAEIQSVSERLQELAPERHDALYLHLAKGVVDSITSFISFSSDIQRNRIEKIIETRLRDLRDLLETQEALTKSLERGGTDLAREDADKVIKEIEKARYVFFQDSQRVSAQSAVRQRAAVPDDIPLIQDTSDEGVVPEEAENVSPETLSLLEEEVSQPVDAHMPEPVRSTAGSGDVDIQQEQHRSLPRRKEEKLDEPQVPLQRLSLTSKKNVRVVPGGGKTAVDSVGADPMKPREQKRLVGPLEEIETLSLEEFRKLGGADTATRKLEEKMDLLALESLLKKKQGIEHWKQSPVYRLYLEMGNMSLDQKKSIQEIADVLKSQNKPYLTNAEFEAIVDLNKRIMFN